jgi:hypothetical protein
MMVISMMFTHGPRWPDDRVHKGGKVHACVQGGEGQEPRFVVVPRVENQSSPRLHPMAAATGMSNDQEGKGVGSNPFIERVGRGSRV